MSYLKPTKNIVRSHGTTGIYRDKHIELDIEPEFHKSQLRINGKPVSNCTGAWIKLLPGKPTTLFLEFEKSKED